MAFYIVPPRGYTTLREMVDIGQKRLEFLKNLLNCETTEQKMNLIQEFADVSGSECLIEGTAKDKLSHFILRICCSHNSQARNFLAESEVAFFQLRWEAQNEAEHKKCYLSLRRQCRLALNEYLQPRLRSLLATLASVSHQLLNGHPGLLAVPFQHVLDMVRLRMVSLNNGKAFVPVEKLKDLLACLFEASLSAGTDQMFKSRMLQHLHGDFRLQKIVKHFQSLFVTSKERPCKSITHEDVDTQVQFFPPCMKHMHQSLRNMHRLSHPARIRYTLFLKEAGLPLDEAICFWRDEYSRLSLSSSCNHVWRAEDHRYLYSLRHMYGLEGCQKNYSSHSCKSIQAWNSSECGCPFANVGSLTALLQEPKEVLRLAEDKHAEAACQKYFITCTSEKTGIEATSNKCFQKPIDFYRKFLLHLDECGTQTTSM